MLERDVVLPVRKEVLMRARVIITDALEEGLEVEQEILGNVAEVVGLQARREEELSGLVEDADVLLVYHRVCITALTINRLKRCRLIVRCGVGYDNVDCGLARQKGIAVANIPHYGTEDVADSAVGLALALCRGLAFLNSRLRSLKGPWSYHPVVPLHRLRGRVFGIVGLGRIGTAVALRVKAMGMRILFYDPYKPRGIDKALGIERAETLDQLLEQSHIVSLHCPLTPETRSMIDSRALSRLPAGAYLVNTARGAIVDTVAVLDAITCGQLAGAALDVLPEEPPPDKDPLVAAWRDPAHPAYDRVIITPHAAFYTEEGLRELRRISAELARKSLLGEPIDTIVN